jgi:Multicopper oxidase
MTPFRQKLHRDLAPTLLWGYNGKYPGPTFDVRRGHPIAVRWSNHLPARHMFQIAPTIHGAEPPTPQVRTVVHVHGLKVLPESDGYPEAWFTNGFAQTGPSFQQQIYRYPNDQQATGLWYHDHALGITRLNLYAGLEGFYFIRDEDEDQLNLPRGPYEVPLMIQDRPDRERVGARQSDRRLDQRALDGCGHGNPARRGHRNLAHHQHDRRRAPDPCPPGAVPDSRPPAVRSEPVPGADCLHRAARPTSAQRARGVQGHGSSLPGGGDTNHREVRLASGHARQSWRPIQIRAPLSHSGARGQRHDAALRRRGVGSQHQASADADAEATPHPARIHRRFILERCVRVHRPQRSIGV